MQQWLSDSLFPESIARQVMGYLTQFSAKASRVGTVGFGFLLLSALSLVLTIDTTLNGIWRVRRARPLAQRVLMYWAVLTFGPLALAALLGMASYAASVSRGLVSALPAVWQFLLDFLEFALVAGGMTALYRFVPNTFVRWRHALAGGLFVALGIELAKKGLALYLSNMPSMSAIYGAFAAAPILLLWIYILWVVVLLGAVMTAYLPNLLAAKVRSGDTPGWRFQLALEVIAMLETARASAAKGWNVADLAQQLQVDGRQLESVIDALVQLDWVGELDDGRDVLLVDLDRTSAAVLVNTLLLPDVPGLDSFRRNSRVAALSGRQLLQADVSA